MNNNFKENVEQMLATTCFFDDSWSVIPDDAAYREPSPVRSRVFNNDGSSCEITIYCSVLVAEIPVRGRTNSARYPQPVRAWILLSISCCRSIRGYVNFSREIWPKTRKSYLLITASCRIMQSVCDRPGKCPCSAFSSWGSHTRSPTPTSPEQIRHTGSV